MNNHDHLMKTRINLVTNLQSEGWLGRTANFNIDVQACFPGAVVVRGECLKACWKALMQAQTVMQLVWSVERNVRYGKCRRVQPIPAGIVSVAFRSTTAPSVFGLIIP